MNIDEDGYLAMNESGGDGVVVAIGRNQTSAPPGTISNDNPGKGDIVGVDTLFTVQFSPGDTIIVGAETETVLRVESDTVMKTTPFDASFADEEYLFPDTPLRFRIFDSGLIEGDQSALTTFIMNPQVSLDLGAVDILSNSIRAAPRITMSGTGDSVVYGVHSQLQIARTGASNPDKAVGSAVYGSYNVATTNTRALPITGTEIANGVHGRVVGAGSGDIGQLSAVVAEANTTAGSGTVSKLFGVTVNGVQGASGKLTNGVGAAIYNVGGANKAYLLLSDSSSSLSVPSGEWAIYDDTDLPTRLSGAVSIGSELVIDADGILHQYGVALPKNNNAATAAPTANDDSGEDYSVGSVWFWPATGRIWKLRDATASAAQWVEIALADDQGYISGNWYMAPDITVTAGETVATGALQLVPMVFKSRVELSDLGVRITTAEHGGNLQLALYANDPATGRPTGSAVATTASISTAAVGPVSAAIVGGNVTLEPGLYWAAFAVDSTADDLVAVQVPSPDNHPTASLIGSNSQANLGASANSDLVSLYVAQTYGTWPNLTSATFVEGSTPSRNGPALHFQVA